MQGSKHLRALRYAARSLRSDRRGVTALEYGIVAGWVAFVVVLAFARMGTDLSTIFTSVGSQI